MFRLAASIVAAGLVALNGTSAHARPVYEQLSPSNTGISSQNFSLGLDSRAADDFFLTGFSTAPHIVTQIQVVMIGNAGFGRVPSAADFSARIHLTGVSSGTLVPGAIYRTLTGASSIALIGPTGVAGMNKYLVTFRPTGNTTLVLPNNNRLWLSVYGHNGGTWKFATKLGPVRNSPARFDGFAFDGWLPSSPATDLAFRIVSIQ